MESQGFEDTFEEGGYGSRKTLEPGSNPDFIVVKNCKTRYGQALTTGVALIYESAEAMRVEPEYIHERHKGFRSGNATEEVEEAKK